MRRGAHGILIPVEQPQYPVNERTGIRYKKGDMIENSEWTYDSLGNKMNNSTRRTWIRAPNGKDVEVEYYRTWQVYGNYSQISEDFDVYVKTNQATTVMFPGQTGFGGNIYPCAAIPDIDYGSFGFRLYDGFTGRIWYNPNDLQNVEYINSYCVIL